jgi:hypothetical protein
VPVEVAQHRAHLHAEHRRIGRRQPAEPVEQEVDGVPGQGLGHHRGPRLHGREHRLVGPDQVGVRQRCEEQPLGAQLGGGDLVAGPFRAQRLADAAAAPLVAPEVVDVQPTSPAEVGDDHVTRSQRVAGRQRRLDRSPGPAVLGGIGAARLDDQRAAYWFSSGSGYRSLRSGNGGDRNPHHLSR